LKIIYVHITDLSTNDTSETFVVNNAISLAEQGVETHLFVTNRSEEDGLTILARKFDLKSFPAKFHLHDIRLKGRSNWSFYRKTVKRLAQKEFDNALIITRKHSLLPHLLLSRKKTQKLLFETHDFFYDLSIRSDLARKKRIKHSLIERLCFDRMDGLICLNKYQQGLYMEKVKIPIKVFPTGFKRQEQGATERSNLLLYIGAFEERKGIENILNLAEILEDNCSIVIIGSRKETELEYLEAEIQQRNIQEKVEIKEWLSKKVGLLPLKSGFFNEYLTVPLKYFDYAAFGLPVIASDFPSLNEYVDEGYNGYLVNWNDLEKVKEKVVQVLADDSLWQELSANQLDKSKSLTWEKRAKDQIKYFETLLSE